MLQIQRANGKVIIGNENEYLMSSKYCIFSHDLNFVDGLEVKMKKYGFEFNEITLLFSECAITYLEETKSTEFIRWSQTKFPKSIFLTFEQINPDDAFGQVMITHFNKIQSPLKSVQKHKTIQQQIQRYLSCGWDWCDGVSAIDMILKMWPAEILWQKLNTEPFDEFEEWHLKCCHYALIVATTTDYSPIWKNFTSRFGRISSVIKTNPPLIEWSEVLDTSVVRYGHACINLNENEVLIIGGFGNKAGKHSRMNTVLSMSFTDCSVKDLHPAKLINKQEQPKWDCMYPTCTKINDNEFVLYGGRTSPYNPVNSKPWFCKVNWNQEKRSCAIVPVEVGTSDRSLEPVARWRHSAALIGPGKVLVYGGLSPGLKVLGDLWLLEISINSNSKIALSWTLITSLDKTTETSIPPPSFSHSAAVHNSTMYISGGFNDSLLPLDHLWAYHLSSGWRKITTAPNMKPRYGHTSHITSDNKLILLGGVNINHLDQPALSIVCLNTYTVSEYKIVPCNPEAPILMIHNHISIYKEEENSIYIIGGGGNCFSFGTHFNTNVARLDVNYFPK
ncbi:tRNA wybutosine-synthesizing protein 4-like isoform X2 [Rhodnius prolixus]